MIYDKAHFAVHGILNSIARASRALRILRGGGIGLGVITCSNPALIGGIECEDLFHEASLALRFRLCKSETYQTIFQIIAHR